MWVLVMNIGTTLDERAVSFEFQPLKAGETFGRLTLHNSDLGYYPYELNLKATPALPEKPVHFQAVLGSGRSIFAKFTNYTRQKTEYYCREGSTSSPLRSGSATQAARPFLNPSRLQLVIPFKNVFYHPVTFSFIVENPAFSVRAMDSMRPKKINNITVYFEGNPSGSKTPITSKLIVACPPGEGSGETGLKWIYYLKGITP
ncbi:Hydrocephalus-inducing protein-like protein [Camelus dromedarius]|uniref:Hydrocephalus-inducing protein-like protein n=1 Tax=Camelus dromedarius TaxID=9838 RepID=A0A5N4DUZ1_CAMDR|nr:Hydrocephalus-inducing protein-like protein [Camelus dromedarius]